MPTSRARRTLALASAALIASLAFGRALAAGEDRALSPRGREETIGRVLLDHDAGDIYWEDAFDTCEELSWYIVDSMPWLLPQHIRYVGQECSTLKRAIKEGECYEQG